MAPCWTTLPRSLTRWLASSAGPTRVPPTAGRTPAYNADRWVASDMQRGDLMLFPSYMLHAVPRNEGEERISIAMNALPERLKSWDYEVSFQS